MVYLVLTREGLSEVSYVARQSKIPVWCTSDAMTEKEFNENRDLNITRLDYSFTVLEREAVTDAVETIREHHSSESIWVESDGNTFLQYV